MGYPKLTPIIAKGATEPRYLEDRFADIVNVKDFGAKGDGSTDDTTALNEAMAAAAGKTLYIPAGVYLTSTGIGVPSNTCVRGDGMDATVLKIKDGTHYGTACLKNEKNTWNRSATWDPAVNTGNSNIVVSDLCVDGNCNRTGTGASGSAVDFRNVHHVLIKNIKAKNGRLHCVDIASALYERESDATLDELYYGASSDVTLENVVACDSLVDDGITTHYSHNIRIINPTVYRTTEPTVTQNGIEIDDGSYDVSVVGGYVSGYTVGLQIKGHTYCPAPAHDVFVYGVTSEANYTNYTITIGDDANYTQSNNISLVNCKSKNLKYRNDIGGCYDLNISRYTNVNIEAFSVVDDDSSVSHSRQAPAILVGAGSKDIKFDCLSFFNIKLGGSPCLRVNNSTSGLVSLKNVYAKNCNNGPICFFVNTKPVVVDGICGERTLEDGETNKPLCVLNSTNLILFDVSDAQIEIKNVIGYSGYSGIVDLNSGGAFTITQTAGREDEYTNIRQSKWKRADSGRSSFSGPTVFKRLGFVASSTQSLRSGEGVLYSFAAKQSDTANKIDSAVVGSYKEVSGDTDESYSLVFGTRKNGDSGTGATLRWKVGSTGDFIPYVDNTYNVGAGSRRIKELFASTGTINTSDKRLKNNIEPVKQELFDAWSKVSFNVFQFNDAIKKKGNSARLHIGIVAQDVAEAFASKGLDANRYGLFCYDEWPEKWNETTVIDADAVVDENGEIVTPAKTHTVKEKIEDAGNRYGIRYEEALALECAYQRWRLEQLEERINQLTNSNK